MESDFFQTIIFVALIWFVCEFYWSRVAAIGLILVGWGAVAIVVPIYLIKVRVGEGDILGAILTFSVCSLQAAMWLFCANGAWVWAKRQERLFGGILEALEQPVTSAASTLSYVIPAPRTRVRGITAGTQASVRTPQLIEAPRSRCI